MPAGRRQVVRHRIRRVAVLSQLAVRIRVGHDQAHRDEVNRSRRRVLVDLPVLFLTGLVQIHVQVVRIRGELGVHLVKVLHPIRLVQDLVPSGSCPGDHGLDHVES